MGLNVATSMTFENREFLRNTAKNILTGKGASQETASKIAQTAIFDNKDLYSNAQLDAIKASVLFSIHGGLKETSKYLKKQAKKEEKRKYILGELFETLESNDESNGAEVSELFDFEIDYSSKNIFAAA